MNVELNAEITLPSGDRIRWDSASPDAGKRPLGPSFDTESGRGFSSGSVVLQRPTDRDYPELRLLNELTLRSPSGQIVYQGRAQGIPVGEAFSFDCDGWITHGEQRQITDLIIDREVSAWGEPTTIVQSSYTVGEQVPYGSDYSVSTEAGEVVFTGVTGKSIPNNSVVVACYRAPAGTSISSLEYNGTQANATSVQAAAVKWSPRSNPDDFSSSATLTLDGTRRSAAVTGAPSGRLLLVAQAGATHTPATTTQFERKIRPAVFGTTGVAGILREDGLTGFTASDGIRYLADRYCPRWSTEDVEESSYPIAHSAWRDPTTPVDAIRQLNGYHLWRLGVWEDRRLTFAPYDLSVADWQVAAGVDGVRVEYQGDTTENVYNGVAVSFTNVLTNEQERLTPDDSEELRDRSEWISANEWGDEVWLNIDVSWPCSAGDAVEIGRIALANANEARRPSTITVPATIRDIHGSEWPASYVRADQTILVTNQSPPVPRLITRTSWADHVLTITTDNAIDTMQAFTQRISGALSASGIV
jgi:hypothetical protein